LADSEEKEQLSKKKPNQSEQGEELIKAKLMY
jgi:hypothetical protein